MPEGLEAALYASAATELVGHQITSIEVDDRCGDSNVLASLVGRHICGVKRHGKRVALETDGAHVELYFAMTLSSYPIEATCVCTHSTVIL